MVSNPPVRAIIIDDSDDLRWVLRTHLGAYPDIEIVAEGSSGEQAARLAAQHKAQVAVVDLQMPVTGRAAIKALRRTRLLKIIVLSAFGEAGRREATSLGADAYVRKGDTERMVRDLADAIYRVMDRRASTPATVTDPPRPGSGEAQ